MKNISIYIDIAFCVIVMPVMIMIFPIERWFHNFPHYVISVGIWLYSLYFINRFVTVPYLFSKKRRNLLTGILIILMSLVITYCFSTVSLYTPKPNIHDIGIERVLPHVQQYQQGVWSLYMIVESFSFAIGLLIQTDIQRSRRRAVEAQRDRAVIELYKAQIKPHFMFNTLNSLYGLFLTGSENALISLEKFISMLRYIHTTSSRDLVQLADEIDYIRQYVDLQTLRLNGMTSISLDINVSDGSIMIPPMLLVTFVENCFKHGVSPIEKSTIGISLIQQNDRLIFHTNNRIFPVRRIGEHMGIENCKKRLGLIYPGRHQLDITDRNLFFDVKLSIDLKPND